MTRSHRHITPGVLLMAAALMMMGTGNLWAQAAPPDLNALTAATPDGDWSMKMWRSLFGDFAENPFSTLGGPTTLLGGVFVIFNGCIFVVGFFWALYGVMSGVVQTAHEGEVLGRRMSTVWFPIRMITGIAGMIPIFGGFTLTQAIMMSLTTIGIGIGNAMWSGAVNNTNQFQAFMQTSTFSPSNMAQIRDSAKTIFMANVCIIAQGQHDTATNVAPVNQFRVSQNTAGSAYSVTYGSEANPTACGSLNAQLQSRTSDGLLDGLSFRSGSVNYLQISRTADDVYRFGMATMQNEIANIARDWYIQRENAVTNNTAVPPVPLDRIDQAANNFVTNSVRAITQAVDAGDGALQQAARRNMLDVGWFGAGAWYSTFAEVNAAIADAAKGPAITSTLMNGPYSTTADDALDQAAESFLVAEAARGNGSSTGDQSRALLDSAITDSCVVLGIEANAIGTATGNCSLGQAVVSAAIRGTAIGSGGGGNGAGNVGLDSEGFVNPVIMMKNMGDYVMSFSSTLILGEKIGDMIGFIASKTPLGKAGEIASSTIGKAVMNTMDSDGSTMAVLKTVAMVTLVLGAAMAIYIPLVPFITWMGAIVAYAASMIEGLAGATLHAMAHLESDGEGMGQRTTHGYLFYVNAVSRPALMIIGFFVASALVVALGTLQAHLFLPAMANVQGNSMTGLFSIIMFLIVFFVMNATLITACFNLIYVITDQVIGFVGGQIDSRLGRDTEDKVNNMFLMAARVGPSAIGQAGAARAAAKDKFAKAQADAGKGAGKDKPG